MKKFILTLVVMCVLILSAATGLKADDGHILIGGRPTPTPTPTPTPENLDGHILIGGRAAPSDDYFSFGQFLAYFGL